MSPISCISIWTGGTLELSWLRTDAHILSETGPRWALRLRLRWRWRGHVNITGTWSLNWVGRTASKACGHILTDMRVLCWNATLSVLSKYCINEESDQSFVMLTTCKTLSDGIPQEISLLYLNHKETECEPLVWINWAVTVIVLSLYSFY